MENQTKQVFYILGDEGSGKTSFINAVSGKTLGEVGSTQEACTKVVCPYEIDSSKVFVDTPGGWAYDRNSDLAKIELFMHQNKHLRQWTGVIYVQNSNKLRLTLHSVLQKYKSLFRGSLEERFLVVCTQYDLLPEKSKTQLKQAIETELRGTSIRHLYWDSYEPLASQNIMLEAELARISAMKGEDEEKASVRSAKLGKDAQQPQEGGCFKC